MDAGYILSNKYRRAVFDELAAGEGNVQRIAKKHRIITAIVHRVIQDFVQNGIVEQKNGRYFFTKAGERLKQTIG